MLLFPHVYHLQENTHILGLIASWNSRICIFNMFVCYTLVQL